MDEAVVQFQPLRLVDTAGRIIAAEGDTITAIGPTLAMGENGCAPIDDMFVVDELIGPGGTGRTPCPFGGTQIPVDRGHQHATINASV
jgi:hypothetical protein